MTEPGAADPPGWTAPRITYLDIGFEICEPAELRGRAAAMAAHLSRAAGG